MKHFPSGPPFSKALRKEISMSRTLHAHLRATILGLLVGLFALPPQPAHAIIGGIVFDPRALAQQIKMEIQSNHQWYIKVQIITQQLQEAVKQVENGVRQFTSLQGILSFAMQTDFIQKLAGERLCNFLVQVRGAIGAQQAIRDTLTISIQSARRIIARARSNIFDIEQNRRDLIGFFQSQMSRVSWGQIVTTPEIENMSWKLRQLRERQERLTADISALVQEREKYLQRLDRLSAPPTTGGQPPPGAEGPCRTSSATPPPSNGQTTNPQEDEAAKIAERQAINQQISSLNERIQALEDQLEQTMKEMGDIAQALQVARRNSGIFAREIIGMADNSDRTSKAIDEAGERINRHVYEQMPKPSPPDSPELQELIDSIVPPKK